MIKVLVRASLLSILILATSCVSKKDVLYFQNKAEEKQILDKKGFALTFKKDDLLTINVTALDLESVKPFNLPTVAYDAVSNTVNGIPKQQSYLIDSNGEINFPVLGVIKLEGLTRVESINLISKKLELYVKGASVNIQILNFNINVMGDVKNPGRFLVQNERITVLDALALSGDLNISGERIIEVKRETETGMVTGYIDLKSNALFSSPYYYLQQNDVVYIKPNNAKMQSASYNQNTGLFISIGSVLISLIAIFIR